MAVVKASRLLLLERAEEVAKGMVMARGSLCSEVIEAKVLAMATAKVLQSVLEQTAPGCRAPAPGAFAPGPHN